MAENSCTINRKLNLNKDLLIATQAIYKGLIDFYLFSVS